MTETNPRTETEELRKMKRKRKRNNLKAESEKPNSIVEDEEKLSMEREEFEEEVGDEKRKSKDKEEAEDNKSEKCLSNGGEDGEGIDGEEEEEKDVGSGWGIMSTEAFSSLPLSGLTMNAINEMKFHNMTQVILIRAFDCSVVGFSICLS